MDSRGFRGCARASPFFKEDEASDLKYYRAISVISVVAVDRGKGLQAFIRCYRGLQGVTKGYKGLQGAYMGLQGA